MSASDDAAATESPPSRKGAWPLFLLAATSFIPGFGFFLGSIALAWGLVSTRPRARAAAVLGFAGALLNLGGALLMLRNTVGKPSMNQARIVVVQRDLNALVEGLEQFRRRHHGYPTALHQLSAISEPTRLVNIFDHGASLLSRRPYEYRLSPDGATYDLFSRGPDDQPMTSDDIRPVLPDSVAKRSGYRPGP